MSTQIYLLMLERKNLISCRFKMIPHYRWKWYHCEFLLFWESKSERAANSSHPFCLPPKHTILVRYCLFSGLNCVSIPKIMYVLFLLYHRLKIIRWAKSRFAISMNLNKIKLLICFKQVKSLHCTVRLTFRQFEKIWLKYLYISNINRIYMSEADKQLNYYQNEKRLS